MSFCRVILLIVVLVWTNLSAYATETTAALAKKVPAYSDVNARRIFSILPRYQKLLHYHWATIHVDHLPLKIGSRDSQVPEIYHRLILLGDEALKGYHHDSDYYNSLVSMTVARFQWRHGLKPDGDLGEKTLKMLNVTPSERLHQLELSMDRWSRFPKNEGAEYILVNIANYRLALVKNGRKVMDMRAIVGKTSRQTPELYSKVDTIVLNPKWNVPYSILRRDIMPKIIQDPHYLEKNNIGVFSSWGKNAKPIDPSTIDWKEAYRKGKFYYFTQLPGKHNALGRIKFSFDNKDNIYLHDTAEPGLFNKVQRTLSSGCIRIGQPYRLAEYIIKENANIDKQDMNQTLSSGETKYVKIKNPIPIYITYITAWVDKQGKAHFRRDLYKRDAADKRNV
jgi:L,D-transpeptidase YcbB